MWPWPHLRRRPGDNSRRLIARHVNLTRKRLKPGAGSFLKETNQMLGLRGIAAKIFGSSNDRKLTKYKARVAEIQRPRARARRPLRQALRARTAKFREEIAAGKSLDDLLVPAFATVREAAKRTLGQRHFDVQLIGGMVLHDGRIAEKKTGEGKTSGARPCPSISTPAAARVYMSLPSTTTCPPRRGLDGQIYASSSFDRRHRARPLRRAAPARLCLRREHMPPTTSWASTTCATT